MKKILPRIYLCVDQGMIWETYSDIPVILIIKNVEKNWIRYLEPNIEKEKISEQEELLKTLIKVGVEQFGLSEEAAKHEKAYTLKKKK